MPQMAPSMWLTLFIIFSCTLVLFAITNYFMINPCTPSIQKQEITFPSTHWKW